MSLPLQVQAKEDRLKELLLILFTLYHNGLVDKTRFLELSSNLTRATAEDVQALVDSDAKRKGFPASDAAVIALLLERVRGDLSQQISDLEAGVSAEEIKIRVEQSAAHVPWASYAESMKAIAGKVGAKLMWHTMEDERVCDYCGPLHGQVFTVDTVPEIPAHPLCRCWLTWV